MQFQFEPDLDYQLDAIESVCDLFLGQESPPSEFSVAHGLVDEQLGLEETEFGIGNRLILSDDDILQNLNAVQIGNELPPSPYLESRDFTVEMETGTGKTYVYLRTIFELNRRYGFTKFAIVVPSIAIKEGVNKSIEMMADHFRALYSGVPFEHFIYDSSKLGRVRNFATSPQIQIMVVTVHAINKRDINSIYQPNEKTGGEKPIDLVRATNPVLIVDEPQSVDGGLKGAGKRALEAMNPLCTLRYSATHVDSYHMVYRLNAVDAYERKLVKQIEVAAGAVEDSHNTPYLRLLSVRRQRNIITARVEVDVETPTGGVRRTEINVQDGDDLELKTGRPIYQDHRIGEIQARRNDPLMELIVPGNSHWLSPGEAYGDVDSRAVQRGMIRKTIAEHFDKEKRLGPLGVKTLTLFFIDQVARYRSYDEDGNQVKGEYARIFEEEYRRAARHRDYRALFEGVDIDTMAERAHNGYFSVDRKGVWKDTYEGNQRDRDNAERAYSLIMRDKEKLLSFSEPLSFIFSHSALREGWDNPNVFQICTLRDIGTERERRQTIGRGLRLCVNQEGERQRGFEVNTLTVIAREGYERFAENLQREIEEDTGIRFGVIELNQFAGISIDDGEGETETLGASRSEYLWNCLRERGYIDSQGKIDDSLRTALSEETLELPDEFESAREDITRILKKAAGRVQIRDASERRRLNPREKVLNSEEFRSLWKRVRGKTTYRVRFDNETLIEECANALRDAPAIPRTRIRWRTADISIETAGIQPRLLERDSQMSLRPEDVETPDLLTELQNRTQLTRKSVQRILLDSGRLDDFTNNPQRFIETASEAINRRKRLALVDGIKYQRLGNEHYYAQELFEREELTGYLRNMLASAKSVYDYVIYDSAIEAEFADALEKNSAVKVYAKLPGWFQVPTPLGPYNPDWAILVEDEDGERLYFVAETKGSAFLDDLRDAERAKVECGKAHFQALETGESPARYRVAHTLDNLLAEL